MSVGAVLVDSKHHYHTCTKKDGPSFVITTNRKAKTEDEACALDRGQDQKMESKGIEPSTFRKSMPLVTMQSGRATTAP